MAQEKKRQLKYKYSLYFERATLVGHVYTPTNNSK